MINATPLMIIIIPKVAIKGGRSKNTVKLPFIKPIIVPTPIPAITAIIIGALKSLITVAVTTPLRAIIAPTERSIPPVMMTNVIPTAIIPITDVCKAIVIKLLNLKKYGDKTPNNINNPKYTNNTVISCDILTLNNGLTIINLLIIILYFP